MYELTAQTARTARRVLRNIEFSFGCFGFSAAYPSQNFAVRTCLRKLLNWSNPDPGIRDIVLFLAYMMIAAQILGAIILMVMAIGDVKP